MIPKPRINLRPAQVLCVGYSTLSFEARDVLAFLGRKVHGNFQGDVVTDQIDFSQMSNGSQGGGSDA